MIGGQYENNLQTVHKNFRTQGLLPSLTPTRLYCDIPSFCFSVVFLKPEVIVFIVSQSTSRSV